MTSQTVNKQLQYTYFPISQEVKVIKMKFGQLMAYNMTCETFFLEKHT